jgi:hypothetical protein
MIPDEKTLLHQLLYVAFMDIRNASCEKKWHADFYRLPHFLHNLPLQLERVQEIEGGYPKIMRDLKERSRILDCESWLDNAIKNIIDWEKIKTNNRNP